ncbi:phosphomannomutase [Azotosporobacter soli]|uniref:phosphomannomutase n=1 Tax=Azotosporobacter soli TaxID=3055040 RepID=UPI0031FF3168
MKAAQRMKRDAFKAYDIRGRVPDELNEAMTYRIGQAFAELFAAKRVAVGRDIRLSSEALTQSLIRGLQAMGCQVLDLGLCGTEMIYFAAQHLELDGGIMVTASHNPIDYNGLKLVRAGARPVSGDTGLRKLEEFVVDAAHVWPLDAHTLPGMVDAFDIMPDYIAHLLRYVNVERLKPLKIVVNAGNGCAGPALDALERHLPFHFVKLNHEPDGTFPNGIPNPLLPENRAATANAVREANADFGIAWDGDFDRCFLFDEQGEFIEGYYMVGLLAEAFLQHQPGAKIIHDPRLTWNTIEMVKAAGGQAIQSKTGHAFIKERMRQEDAVYGGEMSAHHYFKDFAYCDSGMIPWLLVAGLISASGKTLSQLVAARMAAFPVSGEINSTVQDAEQVMRKIEESYIPKALNVDRTDGLSVEYEQWRFNLRTSNTEPLLRLNVESRGDKALVTEKTAELLRVIRGE